MHTGPETSQVFNKSLPLPYKDVLHKESRSQKQLQRRQTHAPVKYLVTTTRQIMPTRHSLPHSHYENDVVCGKHSCLLGTEQGGGLSESEVPSF